MEKQENLCPMEKTQILKNMAAELNPDGEISSMMEAVRAIAHYAENVAEEFNDLIHESEKALALLRAQDIFDAGYHFEEIKIGNVNVYAVDGKPTLQIPEDSMPF